MSKFNVQISISVNEILYVPIDNYIYIYLQLDTLYLLLNINSRS